MAYATYADLVDYMVTVPVPQTEAERLLARASELLDECLIGAWYDTDEDGLPTDAAVALALQNANCAQAAYFIETGDDQGSMGRYSSVHIGDATLTSGLGGRGAAGSSVASRVAPQAKTFLRVAGLLPISPIIWG
jgi:hypothetical protein